MSTTDTSRRFILAPDAAYLKNLAALWACDAKLAAAIEDVDDAEIYPLEASKSGPATVAVKTVQGQSIYLHSRYQPLEEARRLIDAVDVDQSVAFYVLGFGLGYHVEELFSRISDEAILCVIEPDLRLLKTAFGVRDFSAMIESRRVFFFWQLDKSDLFTRLTPCSAMLSLGFGAVHHAASLQVQNQFQLQMQTWIAEFVSYARTSITTLVINGRRTAENITRNIGWYVAAPGIDGLKDRYANAPAIIVSAGPSLRKNKHLLKDLSDRAVIIAVQTTLQPLLEMGVEPHFVTSLDYHDICTRFFEKLPRNLRTHLVAEPKATSKIFALNPGPLSLLGNDFAEKLLRETPPNKAKLTSGCTVAHLAFYLAEYLGCDPVIFVGQDLGFSDGMCYTPGTSYEDVWRPEMGRFSTIEMKQWEQIARERNILRKIPDINGAPMYTEERLFTYLQQFERDFGKSSRRIIDATEGGARKRGTIVMTLAQAIEQFCREPLPQTQKDYPPLRWDRLEDCIKSLQSRRQEANQIEQISRQTLPLLEEVRDHIEDQAQVNRIIARIDALRARMNELGSCYDLIIQLTQLTELQRFQQDRKISASKVQGIERQRRQVGRDIQNVRGVMLAAREFQQLMEQVIGELSATQTRQRREAA